jgi:hypothetical protein
LGGRRETLSGPVNIPEAVKTLKGFVMMTNQAGDLPMGRPAIYFGSLDPKAVPSIF